MVAGTDKEPVVDTTSIRRDLARIWNDVGGYDKLKELAEGDFPSFLKIVVMLEPKLNKSAQPLNDVTNEEIDAAIREALKSRPADGEPSPPPEPEVPAVKRGRAGLPVRPGKLQDPQLPGIKAPTENLLDENGETSLGD